MNSPDVITRARAEKDAVRRLDAVLNDRILSAPTADETRQWWTTKIETKRFLANLPDTEIEDVAAKLLAGLVAGADADARMDPDHAAAQAEHEAWRAARG